jgi:hypothetical protein
VRCYARPALARSRDIRTNQVDIACDICGRTLLRGEHAESYLAGGARKQVCELCTARAQHEGWIRESGGDDLELHRSHRDGRGRSWRERLRGRRERAREVHAEMEAAHDTPGGRRVQAEPREPAVPEPVAHEAPSLPPRSPRHVRAVPTNLELKMQRALEVFNGSDHVRTVGGVARSLGAPAVSVRPLPDRPSVVSITVMWELSWYRYEIDLSDEAGGVRRDAQGDELSDLSPDEQQGNAEADERGALHLAAVSTDG